MKPSVVLLRLSKIGILLSICLMGGSYAPEVVAAEIYLSGVTPLVEVTPSNIYPARQIPELFSPWPATEPAMEGVLEKQLESDAANRSLAFSHHDDPLETLSLHTASIVKSPAGSDSPLQTNANRTVGAGCTYKTIQEAITAANPGDIILIAGGVTFSENINITKNLTLEGGYKGCNSGSLDRTTIDGGGTGRVVEIYPNVHVTLKNLNVTHGLTSWGGGIRTQSNAEMRGTNLHIFENTGTVYGGGVRVMGARIELTSTFIYSNVAPMGAGIFATKYTSYVPQLTFADAVTIEGNQALTGNGFGGGIYLSEGSAAMAQCASVDKNEAIFGGGVYAITSTVTMEGACSSINYNTSVEEGGGLYAQGSSITLLDDVQLSHNKAGVSEVSRGYGGGAFLDDSELKGYHIAITENTATAAGGGVYAGNNSLLELRPGPYTCSGPRCSQLSNNSVNEDGGGIAAHQSVIDLRQTYIENNGGYCGAFYATDSVIYLYNDLFAGNYSIVGVICLSGSDVYGSEVTIADDTTGGDLGIASMGDTSITLARSIIWGYTTSFEEMGHFVICSDIQGGYAGTDNINSDPKFVDPMNGDFTLQGDSPAIDQCLGGLSVDVDNNPRPETYYRSGTPYDMGAYEAGPRVGINASGCLYGSIQDAVDVSSPGDTIILTADTFLETVNIGHSLTVEGGYDTDCLTTVNGTTTIDGSTGSGSVMEISGGLVSLRNLNITGGSGSLGGGIYVLSAANVTLDNTDVISNTGDQGAGIWIHSQAIVTATNGSDIRHNTAAVTGGGVHVLGSFIAQGYAFITQNTATHGGGISVANGGSVLLEGMQVQANKASLTSGKGGGIYAEAGSTISLNGTMISFGSRAYDGGGIYADNAVIRLENNSELYSTSAKNHGGAIYLTNGSTLYASNSGIGVDITDYKNRAKRGAGIYSIDSYIVFDGRIVNNIADDQGAGLYADNSVIHMTDTSIGGESGSQGNVLTAEDAAGAGLYLTNNTQATLTNSHIVSNTFVGSNLTMGGGAYLTGESVMTLTNSSIISNTAPSLSQGLGGGLCVDNSTVVLNNSQVLSNTAGTDGGGIMLKDISTLTSTHASLFQGNQALSGNGGAVEATWFPTVWLKDSIFRGNTAYNQGGALHIDSGELTFRGWMQIEDNSAERLGGGAIAASGTADVDFYVTSGVQPSFIRNNHGGFSMGGAMHLTNDDLVRIQAVSGYQLQILTNTASSGGGAIYASNGPSIRIEGDVLAVGNRVTGGGYGGFVYIEGAGKTLEIKATASGMPKMQLHSAWQGGAVFAFNGAAVICEGAEFGAALNGNYATIWDGGAVYISGGQLTAHNCVFEGNEAVRHGGAIYSSGGVLEITETYLQSNQAANGGALFHTGENAVATLENVLIVGNETAQGGGAGITAADQSTITVTHATISDNIGGAAFSTSLNTSVWLFNSIAWGNTGGFAGTYAGTTCNIDQSGVAGANINPEFIGAGDYHLQATSPAIDACDTGLAIDLENTTRPIGAKYDMGAYEGVGDPYKYVYIPVVMRNDR